VSFLSRAKRAALITICRTAIPGLFGPLTRGAAPILTLHRFADPTLGIRGHDPEQLRRNLGWLRRHDYRLLPLSKVLHLLEQSPDQLRRAVAFTVDDGYDDFWRIGWPVFSEFDCPVTVFLTSDFIDGRIWFWWDRIEYLLERTNRADMHLSLSTGGLRLHWRDDKSRRDMIQQLIERLKFVPEAERSHTLMSLAELSGTGWPDQVPERYAPLTWTRVRELAGKGVAFGPHSVTHPILSRTGAAQSETEITGSWDRLQAECPNALPIFCYPNGQPGDFRISKYWLHTQTR